MAGRRVSFLDTAFLAIESREAMMHVGGLMPFQPPDGAGPDFTRELVGDLENNRDVSAPWNFKLRFPRFLSNPLQSWVEDPAIDLDYHVRRSALPAPGGERELGMLVSRLHSIPLDFHRPAWEMHVIEGLSGGRFAIYSKMHHALVDGYTAMRILARSLSTSPDADDAKLFFRLSERRSPRHSDVPSIAALFGLLRQQLGATSDVTRAMLTLVKAVRAEDKDLVVPLRAPKTIFNRRISRNRRFATQLWDLPRLHAIAKAGNATINDVVLAVTGAALRCLLQELDALPNDPLIALVPVNARPKDDPGGGNQVGAMLASLGTNEASPGKRLEAVVASTRRAKEQLAGMSKAAIVQYSTMLLTPMTVQHLTGTAGRVRPAFNVVISNVPGPKEPLYFRGARLLATYPLSVPFHGYGLNITVNSYADSLSAGFIGCRDALPHLQRLAVYSGHAVAELERELGLPSPD